MFVTGNPDQAQFEEYGRVATPRSRGAEMRINRTLLWSCGERANVVAMRVVDLSGQLLATAPPLRHIALAGDVSLVQQMTAACDQLAESALAAALHREGYAFAQNNELHLWIVVSEDGDTGGGVTGGGVTGGGVTGGGVTGGGVTGGGVTGGGVTGDGVTGGGVTGGGVTGGGVTGDGDGFAESVELLRAIAWQRLRAHLATHALLLAEPCDEDALVGWRQTLETQIDGLCVLAGPVNHQHVRLPSVQWDEQAAHALTGLLWCARPGHTEIDRSALTTGMTAIGGEIWRSPRKALQEWLCAKWANGLIVHLGSMLESSAAPASRLLSTLDQLSSALNTAVPAVASMEMWRTWRPDWAGLADFPTTLLRQADSRSQHDGLRQQQARMALVGAALEKFDADLASLNNRLLGAARQWPQLGAFDAELHAQRQELQRQAAQIADSLLAAAAHVTTAQAQLEQVQSALSRLCEQFPAYSWRGALALALQPWHWPGWLWAYWLDVPRGSRQLSTACAELQQALREEANLHALRQMNLAMTQTVQKALTRLHGLRQLLVNLQGMFAERRQALANRIPEPWTDERLAGLEQKVLGDGAELAWEFLAQMPVLAWPVIGTEDSAGLAAFADKLIGHARPTVEPVTDWSALECMMAAFAAQNAVNGQDDRRDWLNDLLVRAAPLWPPQDAAQDQPGETWLLLPTVQPNRASPGWLTAEMDRFDAWCDEYPQMFCAQGNLDAVCVLRWSA